MGDPPRIEDQFSPMKTAEGYEEIFHNLIHEKGKTL
jgi:hypothetical protein